MRRARPISRWLMGSPQDVTAICHLRTGPSPRRTTPSQDGRVSRRARACLKTDRSSQDGRGPISGRGRLETTHPSRDAAVSRRPYVSRWTRAHLETPAVLRWARPRLETYSFRDDHPISRRAVSRWATPSWDGGVRFPKAPVGPRLGLGRSRYVVQPIMPWCMDEFMRHE